MKFANPCKEFLGVLRNNPGMTKTKIEHPDLQEIAAIRVRWKRTAGATGETFARWRLRLKQKCSTNYAKSLMTTGADGPIRASVILANRSGVNAGGRFSLRMMFRHVVTELAIARAAGTMPQRIVLRSRKSDQALPR